MAFTGVSFVGNGTPWTQQSASAISAARDCSGYHLLVVQGYSSTKTHTPKGKCLRSRRFRVGGYHWLIECYPNGSLSDDLDHMSFYLYLDEDNIVEGPVEVDVQCKFGFVDQDVDRYISFSGNKSYNFSSLGCWRCLGVHRRVNFEKYHLEGRDSFTLRCDVKVTKPVSDVAATPFAVVQPPDIQQHLNGLLLSGDGADVTFEVNGEAFVAHRCVLAARSSVFKAELFGPMVEGTTRNVIRIDDIEAQVFKLLLSFIYSDSVPEDDEEEDKDMDVIWQHLLVAADRYDLQRLRLMCEVKLCGYINTATVVPILELAEQHYCRGLKEACLDFLSSPSNLQPAVSAGVLDHLIISTCPSVLKELIVKIASLKFDVNFGDTSAAVLPLLEVPESDLHQHFSWLLQSEEGTDVTFQVGGMKLSAHRCLLAARSTVFRAELFGQMKDDSTTDVIRIDDMEASVFRLLLSFIYSDSVPNMEEEDKEELEKHEDDHADVTCWQHLLMAADRYDLQRLRTICEVNLWKYINVTSVAKILVLAEKHNYGWLKESCLDFLEIPANLQQVMAAGGLNHLRSSCSSILIDLIAKLAA